MSYIEPNSTVQIYRGIPIDDNYNNTLYFSTATAQADWFASASNYLVQTVESVSYIRKGRNNIRLTPNNWTSIYQCNYLRFKNTSFENKWFYCFIDSVEYINNNTVEISFSIDYIQTWFIGANAHLGMKPSYVIRQHALNDSIRGNIQPEPLELGEYTTSGTVAQVGANSIGIVVAIVDTNNATSGALTGGVYSGATLFYYSAGATSAIDAKLNEYLQHPDSILAIYAVPALGLDSGTEITNWQGGSSFVRIDGVSSTDDIDGYTPKNLKCYTYPFNFIRIFTYEGNYADFRYEYFNSGTADFTVNYCINQPVKAICNPSNYKGSHSTDSTPLPTEGVSITTYPVCCWNNDTFKTWMAQNSVPLINSKAAQDDKVALRTKMANRHAVTGTLSGLAGATSSLGLGLLGTLATGNPLSAVAGTSHAINQAGSAIVDSINTVKDQKIMNKISDIDFDTEQANATYTASIQADTIHGDIGSGNTSLAQGRPGFYAVRVYQKQSYIRRVDNFFQMYGYAVNDVAVPNIHARDKWTYIKVSDIQLTSTMPADALGYIKKIFEDGIRFWVNPSEVGQYSLVNGSVS